MRTRALAGAVVGCVIAGVLSVLVLTAPVAASVSGNAAAAVNYARAHGYRSSIAVIDTQTGGFSGAGDYTSAYASESVMKTFIATRLLLTGQMTGWNETTAYKMITQSDDASANALYGRTGGDGIITWIKQTLNLPALGSGPLRPGWWGGTQITARGMAQFYNAVRARPVVWNWLGNAMHHATEHGSDGTYQFFGIPSATTGAAIKQGWGGDDAAGLPEFNSTGLVNADRYAVVILTQGGTYGAPISAILTSEARLLMPGGRIASDDPAGAYETTTLRGRYVTVHGWAFDPNTPTAALRIFMYVNGKPYTYGPTSIPRADVNAANQITGNHGFALTGTLADGTNLVCAYAVNVGAGKTIRLGCRNVVLTGAPVGGTSGPTVARGNVVTFRGWSVDYDAPSTALSVVAYVNGQIAASVRSSVARPDINAAFRTTGLHGYALPIKLATGTSTVCTYALTVGPGPNTKLGCKTVVLTGAPIGGTSGPTVASGRVVTFRGWSYDYDEPDTGLTVVAYVNGKITASARSTVPRPDINAAFGIAGVHGYALPIKLDTGTSMVCTYALTVGPGLNTKLGCKTVTLP